MHESIKNFNDRLRETLQSGDGSSINDPKNPLWTSQNFNNLYKAVDSNPKEGKGSFIKKISLQIEESANTVPGMSKGDQNALLPLVFELLSLYYVFPPSISISADTKKNALEELLSNDNSIAKGLNLSIDNFNVSREAILAGGVRSGGMGFNTNKQKEIFYLIDVFKEWFNTPPAKFNSLIDNQKGNFRFQNFLDRVANGRSPQCRHVLLYLLFPEYYEPIISSTKKWKITQVFSSFVSEDQVSNEWLKTKPNDLTDQKIKVISNELKKIRGKRTDFYDKELASFWNSSSISVIPNLDTELLEYKKQVVLYGPPGTSKTYTAKRLSEEIIRYLMVKDIGAPILQDDGQRKLTQALKNNIHRLQLHPAYSYEDFILGLQFEDGNTSYKKGYLLRLLDSMEKEPELPHVLILDEINRVDLSRLFGEVFSALENRGESIDLPGASDGKNIWLNIPDNLYIIGTMNLIDHSVEQLDFALRRRFLWFEVSYNADALLEICKSKWNDLVWDNKSFSWDKVESDFERLVRAATSLNKKIQNEDELGEDFVLGHVFFIESVPFLHQFLRPYSINPNIFLFTSEGDWRKPIKKLWNLSLYPLLKEYLSGLDNSARDQIMKRLEGAFKP